ncbi:hypothetical protein DPMN_188624 [Dreissena polymorpha]|uniref:Uncharacterized protein n=1 Tax=Dreissena polymorpha TaxID=45954 RepID=A0A9D4IBI1_DREPO|nr:hypothetical protein DPMN_188624 [Dreissena polymorpha]
MVAVTDSPDSQLHPELNFRAPNQQTLSPRLATTSSLLVLAVYPESRPPDARQTRWASYQLIFVVFCTTWMDVCVA